MTRPVQAPSDPPRGLDQPYARDGACVKPNQRCSRLGKLNRAPASHSERWLPWAGMPPTSLSTRSMCRRLHVAKVVFAVGGVVLGASRAIVQEGRARGRLADPARPLAAG